MLHATKGGFGLLYLLCMLGSSTDHTPGGFGMLWTASLHSH
jgi:hypothetical protein